MSLHRKVLEFAKQFNGVFAYVPLKCLLVMRPNQLKLSNIFPHTFEIRIVRENIKVLRVRAGRHRPQRPCLKMQGDAQEEGAPGIKLN